MPTGHPVSGQRFEDVDAAWLEVDESGDPSCWIREDAAVPRSEYRAAGSEIEGPKEVDVARVTLRSPDFIQLAKFKVLETFDVGTRLAGCRLTVDLSDTKRMERLRKASSLNKTNLADGVRQLLPRIESTYGSLDGWEDWVHPPKKPD